MYMSYRTHCVLDENIAQERFRNEEKCAEQVNAIKNESETEQEQLKSEIESFRSELSKMKNETEQQRKDLDDSAVIL